jgi:hypothetical protein
VTGILHGTMDFDPAVDRPDGSDILTPRGSTDAFVAKYAPDNTLFWARRMGSDHVNVNTYLFEKARTSPSTGPGRCVSLGGRLVPIQGGSRPRSARR